MKKNTTLPKTTFAFKRVAYEALNSRQQESFNFQKVSAVLADFGFTTMRLSDDWNGADFIAQHIDGETLLIQQKSRLCFYEKYRNKNLWVCFPHEGKWYLYPHDELLDRVLAVTNIANTSSWRDAGGYSFPNLSRQLRDLVAPYVLGAADSDGSTP